MSYTVNVRRLADGRFRGRCDTGSEGLIVAEAADREALVARIESELRYRLELCPCSRRAADGLRLELVEAAGPSGGRQDAANRGHRSRIDPAR